MVSFYRENSFIMVSKTQLSPTPTWPSGKKKEKDRENIKKYILSKEPIGSTELVEQFSQRYWKWITCMMTKTAT